MQRREVFYSGRVQGVGFRYTARRVAADYRVTGFVRNLPDGRVHLVVEGQTSELNAFLRRLADAMQDYIRDQTVGNLAASGEFTDFEIRF